MDERITEIRKHLKKKLNPMRYEHTLGVSYTCMALAMRYSANLDQAEMAGLLHDCAKRYDDATIICKCQEHGIELTEGELRAPAVIHAKLGALHCRGEVQPSPPDPDWHCNALPEPCMCHGWQNTSMVLPIQRSYLQSPAIRPENRRCPC